MYADIIYMYIYAVVIGLLAVAVGSLAFVLRLSTALYMLLLLFSQILNVYIR